MTREQAEPLSGLLKARGLDCVHVPLVALEATGFDAPTPPPDSALVTSAAVVRFVPDLVSHLGSARVVAVGQKTAEALIEAGVSVSGVGTSGGVQALDLLGVQAEEYAWYVGAEAPSDALEQAMRDTQMVRWAVYRNHVPRDAERRLLDCEYDVVTFASGSAVRAFVSAVGVPTVPTVVLGHSTRIVADSLGVPVTAVAAAPTMLALAQAVPTTR